MHDDPDDFTPSLDGDDLAIVELLQLRLMTKDVEAERAVERRAKKLDTRDETADRLASILAVAPPGASSWRLELTESLRERTTIEAREVLARSGRTASAHIKGREDALCVLVALATSSPWPDGLAWVPAARIRVLQDVASELDDAGQADVEAIEHELGKLLRTMKREQIPWGRVAAAGAAGVVLGAVTMGYAAPMVGAALGGAMGLSGAAATSAGLAALGGGSLAVGGFGMAGGAAFVASAGGLLGAGLGAGGMRVAGCPTQSPVQDVVRTELLARLLFEHERTDDEALRRVVLVMEEKLVEVRSKVSLLAERVRQLEEEKRELESEVARLRQSKGPEEAPSPELFEAEEKLERNGRHRAESRTLRSELQLLVVALRAAIRRLQRRFAG
ncbi:hypothetical protein [Actinomycetospora termitidis]|uniref:Uncharacterized protein n=1 Tax=Actinomycetospora termitidis TaxID=3053470 RepID=A0ABT7MKY7_9PSEU|nr:hypothetical protein [Actinomycetospora sp. Odt1-22]MDL5160018.1 hypothetical protein [Actinomycetospora sp. Odt1-22]